MKGGEWIMALTKGKYRNRDESDEPRVGSKEESQDAKIERLLELERKTDKTDEEKEEVIRLRRETRPGPNSKPVPAT